MKRRTIIVGWLLFILNTIFTLSSIPSDKIMAIENPLLKYLYFLNFGAMVVISIGLFVMLFMKPIGWWLLIITLALCSFEMLAGLIVAVFSNYFPVRLSDVVIYLLYFSIPLIFLITDPPGKWAILKSNLSKS